MYFTYYSSIENPSFLFLLCAYSTFFVWLVFVVLDTKPRLYTAELFNHWAISPTLDLKFEENVLVL